MKRLTERDEFGNADIIALSDVMPELYAELPFSEATALTEALNRFAAYEDIGLEPEEVKEFLEDVESRFVLWINKRYGIPATKFMDIMQAEKEGRLAILPKESLERRKSNA